jgi:hypothetical protein
MNVQGVIGELTSLPGCSQVAVSHSVFVPEGRDKGAGRNANKERCRIAFEELGYDGLLCTVADNNAAQIKIMEANGWEYLTGFLSRKTGNGVSLYFKARVST